MFSLPEPLDRFIVGGVRGQVKTTQSLNSNDFALLKQLPGFLNRITCTNLLARMSPETHQGAAIPTGIGLGMKSAVRGIMIFCFAGRTHLETLHGRKRPVIWDVHNDGVTRAAVRAIDKRIPETSVLWVKQLPQTIFTYAYIRGNKRPAVFLCLALVNGKVRI